MNTCWDPGGGLGSGGELSSQTRQIPVLGAEVLTWLDGETEMEGALTR